MYAMQRIARSHSSMHFCCQQNEHPDTDMHQVTADRPTSSVCMADAKASGDGLHKKPVTPCCTLSLGPPLSQAMTGLPDAMASKGTMPKCSFCGVYSTAVHAAKRAARCSSVKEGSKNTCNTHLLSAGLLLKTNLTSSYGECKKDVVHVWHLYYHLYYHLCDHPYHHLFMTN